MQALIMGTKVSSACSLKGRSRLTGARPCTSIKERSETVNGLDVTKFEYVLIRE